MSVRKNAKGNKVAMKILCVYNFLFSGMKKVQIGQNCPHS